MGVKIAPKYAVLHTTNTATIENKNKSEKISTNPGHKTPDLSR
jgi:hypothetical protein